MTGIKRAFILATTDRYIGLIVNFVLIAMTSRLLTPAEIGVSAIGMGIMAILLSLRDFAGCDYLIQRAEITLDDARTAFTMLLVLTIGCAALLVLVAPALADFYREPGLLHFLYVIAFASIVTAIGQPTVALLRRDMAFGTIAIVNIAANISNAVVTIVLARLGFSFMSFAWGLVVLGLVTSLMAIALRPSLSIFRPSLRNWRHAVNFGGYNGALGVLRNAYESVPQLLLGRILPLQAVGLYNRSNNLASLPDKFILSGIFSVALPAFAAQLRAGRNLKGAYLNMLGHITLFYWPGLIMLALLAEPVVRIILGPQWQDAVPLIQILSLAALFFFPGTLNSPILQAVGAVRDNFIANVISLPLSALLLCCTAFLGVEVMAASQLIAIPMQMYIASIFIRRHIPYSWADLGQALWRSVIVTICAIAAPAVLMATTTTPGSLTVMALAILLAAIGWLAGILLTRHPLLGEVMQIATPILHKVARLMNLRRLASGRVA